MPLDWKAIQDKWRKRWDVEKIFEAEPKENRKKYFVTVAYPYPNSPQHVGHGRTYALADVHARYMRMQGYNVLFPMGFHYTGTPILAMSKRVQIKDRDLINTFIKIYKVPENEIETFVKPINIAKYFHNEIKLGMKEMGFAIDWRREFTTVDDAYTKFIGWQFRKLKEKGLVVQGSHPVGWCPNDGNPVSQHDTLGDVEPEFTEYTLIKFELEGNIVLTATLRPEMIFGVTNLWINPEGEYVRARIDGEYWMISVKCAEKLRFLNRNVEIKNTFKGKELVGKKIMVPIVNKKVTIFPAGFVEPKDGTGIVMSVPAHAPDDYQALEDLKKNQILLENFMLDYEQLEAIKPIVIIESEGYEGIPAAVAINKFTSKIQDESNLQDATSSLYSHEYHKGKMLDNTMQYSGMKVVEARDKVNDELQNKFADTMLELNTPVTCRCGAECTVKILNDQWFINYSDSDWKSSTHECIDGMELIPFEMRTEFNYTVDWLKERACARKSGLGTELPWDTEWVIESLSDSVIYMAYYIIAKYINDHSLSNTKFKDLFFDYIFLGNGIAEEVAKSCNISVELLDRIRYDFEYFYPVDTRHSGRDLVANHLSFFVFNHTAIFTKPKWPKQIVVNGSILMEGKKMSKSMGNIIPLRSAAHDHGADAIRISMLIASELLQDANFTLDSVKGARERLERIYNMCVRFKKKDLDQLEPEDRWMLSKLHHVIESTTIAMEKLRVREALHNIINSMDQDVHWYLKRASAKERNEQSISAVMKGVLDNRIRLLAPFAPFISEEMWEILGNKNSIISANWPKVDPTRIDYTSDESEIIIMNLLVDGKNIIKITKIKPKKIFIYVASESKWNVYNRILNAIIEGMTNFGEIMKLLHSSQPNSKIECTPAMVKRMIEDALSVPYDSRLRKANILWLDESKILNDAKSLLVREFDAEIVIYNENDSERIDPKKKATMARPYKPALYIE